MAQPAVYDFADACCVFGDFPSTVDTEAMCGIFERCSKPQPSIYDRADIECASGHELARLGEAISYLLHAQQTPYGLCEPDAPLLVTPWSRTVDFETFKTIVLDTNTLQASSPEWALVTPMAESRESKTLNPAAPEYGQVTSVADWLRTGEEPWVMEAIGAAHGLGYNAEYVERFDAAAIDKLSLNGQFNIGYVDMKTSDSLFTAPSALSTGLDQYFQCGGRSIKWDNRLMFTTTDTDAGYITVAVPFKMRTWTSKPLPCGSRLVHVTRPYEYSRYFRADAAPWERTAREAVLTLELSGEGDFHNALSQALEEVHGVVLTGAPFRMDDEMRYIVYHAADADIDQDLLSDTVMGCAEGRVKAVRIEPVRL